MPDESQVTKGQIDLRDEGPMIVATVPLPDCTPDRALSAFTDPDLLASWWRGALTAELVPGGEYSRLVRRDTSAAQRPRARLPARQLARIQLGLGR